MALNRSRDQHVGFKVAPGCQFLERQIDSLNEPGDFIFCTLALRFGIFRGTFFYFIFNLFIYNLDNRGSVKPHAVPLSILRRAG